MNADDIVLASDQPLAVTKFDLHVFLDYIDTHFSYELVDRLVQFSQVSGVGLAKALYLAKKNRAEGTSEEDFYEEAMGRWGKSRATVQRYVRVWTFVESAPKKLRDKFLNMNIGNIIPPATALENGEIVLEAGDWKELADISDNSEMLEKVRKLKGVEPKTGTLTLKMDAEGNIYGWLNGGREFIGYLDVKRQDVEIVDRGIKRILNKTGIKVD
jgi:hypothetical protein